MSSTTLAEAASVTAEVPELAASEAEVASGLQISRTAMATKLRFMVWISLSNRVTSMRTANLRSLSAWSQPRLERFLAP